MRNRGQRSKKSFDLDARGTMKRDADGEGKREDAPPRKMKATRNVILPRSYLRDATEPVQPRA